jgi:PAS domain S-box-containing protein
MYQVIDFFSKLFDSTDWPSQWQTGRWTTFHGWFYIVSDLLIGCAYCCIPLAIVQYISGKHDIRVKNSYFLFAAFSLAGAATHLLDALSFWNPVYRLSALVRFITGVLSWIIVFYLIRMLPFVFSLRSKKTLETEVTHRKDAEEQIRQLNAALEQRVMERTEQLLKSEQKYRHLFESNPMPMWIIDLSTFRFLDVNEAAIVHYGYSHQEFLSMTALDIRPEEEVELFKQADHTAAITPNQYRRGQWRHRKKDGSVINVEIVAHNIQFEGRTARFILSNDVTARIQAEQELRENQRLLTAIVDNSEAVIYVKDLQGRYLMVNQRFRDLFHVTDQSITAMTDFDIFAPSVATAIRAMDERVAKAGHPVTEEEVVPLQNGNQTYISVKSTLLDNTGQPNAIFGISTDITKVKEVEENLRKSLREISDYKFALDQSSIVAITDQKGCITYVNDNFCTISKYTREELLGQDHRIINSGFHPAAFIRHLWITIANGRIWKGELKNKAKDGTFYWVDTTIVPFLDEKGKPYQYIAIRSDITSRKQAEAALQMLNEELEERVSLRTNQLEVANKELESFSYSVSHDLRAPLRGIIGYTSMLEEDYAPHLDAEGLRITSIIKRNTLKMGHLIDGLLMFSRMTRQDIMKTGLDMGKMVQEIIEEQSPASKADWDLHTLPIVKGDYNTVRQVWINLISNAVKYSANHQHPHIEIGSFIQDHQTVFYVKDNGVGFDNKYRDKLFKVFQRLHSYDQFEGTGVGLALVEKIISKHGGNVWAEAMLDKGATFYFSLPLE